jgi:hypothetical protein
MSKCGSMAANPDQNRGVFPIWMESLPTPKLRRILMTIVRVRSYNVSL